MKDKTNNQAKYEAFKESDEYKYLSEIYPRRTELVPKLHQSIKENLPFINKVLKEAIYPHEADGVYRFYHHSNKIFILQSSIRSAEVLFKKIAPENIRLNFSFEKIVQDALKVEFDFDFENEYQEGFDSRYILEAFWHCKYFLEQMSVYGKDLEEDPKSFIPPGWASILYLYNLR